MFNTVKQILRSLAVFFTSSLFLGGCLQSTSAISYYSLSPPIAYEPKNRANKTLVVGPLSLAPHLDQPLLVSRDKKNKIIYLPDIQWAGRIDKLIADQLFNNLAGPLTATAVLPFPALIPAEECDLQLKLRVLQFEASDSDTATVSAQWQLFERKTKKLILNRLSLVHIKITDDLYANLAVSLSKGLEQLSREIVREYWATQPQQCNTYR